MPFDPLEKQQKFEITPNQVDSLFTIAVVSVILGGRLGYIVFYNLEYYIQNPLEIFAVWHGGMGFHGAIIALNIGFFSFCIINKQKFLKI